MNIQTSTLLIPIISYAILLYIVFFHREKKANQFFLLMVFSFLAWNVEALLTHLTNDVNVAIIITKVVFITCLFALYFLFLFSVYFPQEDTWTLKFHPFLLIANISVSALTFLTKGIIQLIPGRTPAEGNIFQSGPYFDIFLVVALLNIICIIYSFTTSWFKAKGIYRVQLKYVFIGTLLSCFLGIITGLIFPLLNITNSENFTPFIPFIAVLFFTYAILKHRFLDLKIIIGNLMHAVFLALYVNIAFYGVIFFELMTFKTLFSAEVISLDIGISILFTVSFLLLNRYISILTKEYSGANQLQSITKEIEDIILTDTDLQRSLKDIFAYISRTCKIDNIYVYTQFESNQFTYPEHSDLDFLTFEDKMKLINSIPFVYITEENKESTDLYNYNLLYNNNISAYIKVNINLNNKAIFLLVNHDIDNKVYSVGDILFLKTVLKETAIFINRTLLYQEIKDFNSNLQEQIVSATQELQEKNVSLQEAYNQLKDATQREHDMLDIMGHELRTPATIVKMGAYILDGKVTDPSEKKYVTEIKESIDREIELINTLLSSAKVDNAKLEIIPTYGDIIQIIKQVIEDQKINIDNKDISLNFYEPDKTIPKTMFDKDRIIEVLNNYISNAIKYTEHGEITINLNLSEDNKSIIFSIKDHGIGFKPEDKDYLFQKFHRLNNYTDNTNNQNFLVRPGGSGLGLFVIKGIIESHGGNVWAESDGVNMGSAFYFSIPIKEQ